MSKAYSADPYLVLSLTCSFSRHHFAVQLWLLWRKGDFFEYCTYLFSSSELWIPQCFSMDTWQFRFISEGKKNPWGVEHIVLRCEQHISIILPCHFFFPTDENPLPPPPLIWKSVLSLPPPPPSVPHSLHRAPSLHFHFPAYCIQMAAYERVVYLSPPWTGTQQTHTYCRPVTHLVPEGWHMGYYS